MILLNKFVKLCIDAMPMPGIYDDFVCFVATDSESERGEDYDSLSEESDAENVPNHHATSAVGGSMKAATKAGLQPNGWLYTLRLFQECIKFCIITNYNCLEGYYDDGDPSYMCEHCGAYMWYGERLNKRVKRGKPIFSMCCHKGKVKLPLLKTPPNTLSSLFYNHDDRSTNFRDNIRAYNMMFSFTSLGGTINHSINNGRGPYLFQMCGENYHRIGDILPDPDKTPVFLQLYIHDTVNEVSNRLAAFG